MRKITVLTALVAAAFAAVGAGTASAGGTCTPGALDAVFTKNVIQSGSTPFGTGTATVSGVTSASSTSATVTLDDGSGDTLTFTLTGTTVLKSGHLEFTIGSGAVAGGTGACAGATGSVGGGVLKGENGNTKWEATTDVTGTFSIGGGAGAATPPPPPPDNAFLCYSAFEDNPGVWVMPVATQLLQQGYWSPYAVPGNVAGGTNIGGYHLTCNLASGQSASDSTLGGAGETYGASDKSVVSDVPGHYAIVGS